MLGHASIESTQLYTQVSIRALSAVHASTHPAEREVEENIGLLADLMAAEQPEVERDRPENSLHNDNTNDTTKVMR